MELVIDISEKRIRIIEGRLHKGTVVLNNRVNIDDIDVVFESGRILNFNEIGALIQTALKEKGIKTKKASVIMRSADFLYKDISVPKAGRQKVEKMAVNSISAQGNLSQHFIDCFVSGVYKEEERDFYKVTTYAIKKDIVQSYYAVLKAAKLIPLRLDLERNAIRKLVKSGVHVNGNPLPPVSLFIDLSFTSLMLNVIVENEPVFSKKIRYKSSVLQFFASEEQKDVQEGMAALLRLISEEAYKMMQFSMSNAIKHPISTIYLFGLKDEGMRYIAENIAEDLGINVEAVNDVSKTENVTQISEVLVSMSSLFQYDDIVFFDQEKKEVASRKKPSQTFFLIMHFIIILAIGAGAYAFVDYSRRQNVEAIAVENARIQALLDARQGDYAQTAQDVIDFDKLIEQIIEIKTMAESGTSLKTEYLTDIIFSLKPDSITFTSLRYDNGTFRIGIVATDKLTAANYCGKLAQNENIEDVTYTGTNETSLGYISDITIKVRSVSVDE